MKINKLLPLCLLGAVPLLFSAPSLQNKYARFLFTEETGALKAVENIATGRSISINNPTSLWSVKLADATDLPEIIPTGKPATTLKKDGGTQVMTLTWTGSVKDKANYKAVLTVTLPDNSGIADWNMQFTLDGNPAPWIKQLHFPRLEALESLGDDRVIYGDQMGRQIRFPGKRAPFVSADHPGRLGMQFAAFFGSSTVTPGTLPTGNTVDGFQRGNADDETGLFLAANDDAHWHKVFQIDRKPENCFLMTFINFPELPFWPPESGKRSNTFSWKLPYSFKMGTYKGGAGEAAALYRDMVKDWDFLKDGPIYSDSNKLSPKVRDCAFWGKFYCGAPKIVPELLTMRDYLRVPVNTHWVRFNTNPFDENNTNYFPTTAHFREGTETLKEAGIGVAPYVCCALWDPDTETYTRYGMEDSIVYTEFCKPLEWMLCKQPNYYMDPSSENWRNQYTNVTKKLYGQWDTDGQYLDVMAMDSKLSYLSKFHKPHGGTYWNDGNQKLLAQLITETGKLQDSPFLTSEGFCENYIGKIDAFLVLDVHRYGWNECAATEIFPLHPLVYHDYSVFYGSDCEQQLTEDMFRWEMGLSFVWGVQPTFAPYVVELPGPLPHDIMTRNVTRAWYRTGSKFLTGGKGINIAQVSTQADALNAPAALVSKPHTLKGKGMLQGFTWKGPAVPASAWTAHDGTTGFTLVNITDADQNAELIIDKEKLAPAFDTVWRTWPLPAKKLGTLTDNYKLALTIPVNDCMILEIRDDTEPEVRPLIEIKDIAMTADKYGAFQPAPAKGDALFACRDITTCRADGEYTLLDKDGNPASSKIINWRKIEGYSGPHAKEYRTFYLLQDSGCTLDSSAKALVTLDKGVLLADAELPSPAVFAGKGKVLLANNGKRVFFAEDELALAPGSWKLAAWPKTNFVPDSINLMKSLAEITQLATQKAKQFLTGDDALNTNDRAEGERLLAIVRAISSVTIGKTVEISAPNSWLLTGVDMALKYSAPAKGTLELLNTAHKAETEIIPDTDNSFTVRIGDVECAANIFRFLFTSQVKVNGTVFTLAKLDYFEVAEPLIIDTPPNEYESMVKNAGVKSFETRIYVRNVSPFKLPIKITAKLPGNWKLLNNDTEFTLEPNSMKTPKLQLKLDGKPTDAETEQFEFLVNYSDKDWTAHREIHTVKYKHFSLKSAAKGGDGTMRWTGLTRNKNMIAIPDCGKKEVTLAIKPHANLKVPTQNAVINVMDSNFNTVAERRIHFKDANAEEVKLPLNSKGGTFIVIDCRFYSVGVAGVPNFGFSANMESRFPFFTANGWKPVYFYVEKGAKSFILRGEDGGPTETAAVTVYDSSGNVAFTRNGRFQKEAPIEIKVPEGMDGKVWSLKTTPREDLELMLENGAAPWFSLDKDSVIQ